MKFQITILTKNQSRFIGVPERIAEEALEDLRKQSSEAGEALETVILGRLTESWEKTDVFQIMGAKCAGVGGETFQHWAIATSEIVALSLALMSEEDEEEG